MPRFALQRGRSVKNFGYYHGNPGVEPDVRRGLEQDSPPGIREGAIVDDPRAEEEGAADSGWNYDDQPTKSSYAGGGPVNTNPMFRGPRRGFAPQGMTGRPQQTQSYAPPRPMQTALPTEPQQGAAAPSPSANPMGGMNVPSGGNAPAPSGGALTFGGGGQHFDLGGSVDDNTDQDTGAIPTGIDDTGGSEDAQTSNNSGSGVQDALGVVKEAMGFRRQAAGLGGKQVADNQYNERPPAASQSELNDNSPQSWTGNPATQKVRGPLQINPTKKFDPRAFMQKQSQADIDQDTQAFDDGGAVEDDQTDQGNVEGTSAIPEDQGQPMQGEAQGQAAMPTEQEGVASPQHGPHMDMGSNPRLLRYLQGADGDPNLLNQLSRQVDPTGQMEPDERNLAVVKAAADQGGPEASAKILASNIQAFNAKQTFARAALNGTQGKPGDIRAAAQAATQAYSHMLDGNKATFTPSENGVTVTVNRLGEDKPIAQEELNPQQFDNLLNIGKDGLYDSVYERGLAPVLKTLKQQQGQPVPQGQPQGQQPQGQQPQGQQSQGQQSQGQQSQAPTMEQRYAQANAIASKLFPMVSQGAKRAEYIQKVLAAQGEQQSKLDVAKNTRLYGSQATAAGKAEAAKIYAGGRVQAAEVQAGWRNEQSRQSYLNALVRAGGAVLAKKIGNVPFGTELSPQDAQAASDLISRAAGGGGQAAPQQQQPQQQPAANTQPGAGAPQIGEVRKGYRYKGGPAGDRSSWEPAQ